MATGSKARALHDDRVPVASKRSVNARRRAVSAQCRWTNSPPLGHGGADERHSSQRFTA